jgi:hypothetical protein
MREYGSRKLPANKYPNSLASVKAHASNTPYIYYPLQRCWLPIIPIPCLIISSSKNVFERGRKIGILNVRAASIDCAFQCQLPEKVDITQQTLREMNNSSLHVIFDIKPYFSEAVHQGFR